MSMTHTNVIAVMALLFSLLMISHHPALSQPPPTGGGSGGPPPTGGGGTGSGPPGGSTGGGGGGGGGQQSGSGVVCPVPATPITPTVSFAFGSSSVTIRSTQCPPYNWTLQSTGNQVQKGCVTYTYPYPPKINAAGPLYIGVWKDLAKTITNSLPVKNTIGMATNGVAIFSNTDGENRDAYVYEASTFDQCLGHAQPQGLYHYHCEPTAGCVYSDTKGQHSPLFGVMADGIPIYGHLGDNGTVPADLDECNGHVDATYPFYHYHLPNQTNGMHTYPYTVNCLRGCVTLGTLQDVTNVTCVAASTQYDYSVFKTQLSAFSSADYTCSLPSSSSSTGIHFSAVDHRNVVNWVHVLVATVMALLGVSFLH